MSHIPDSPERQAALAEHAAMAAERAAWLAWWADVLAALPASDEPEADGARITRRRADRLTPAAPGLTSARMRFLRGSDRLHAEQVDQYAATTTALMAAGMIEPIGPRFSRAARQMNAHQARIRRTMVGRDVAAHRLMFPDAYAAPVSAIPPRPAVLSDVLVSDGVGRPAIPAIRRFDWDDRTSADLERAATALLRDAGDLAAWNLAPAPYAADDGTIRTPGMHHVDTVHRYTRQPQVAPDPVAFLGEQRWEPRAALTYRTEPITDLIDTGVPGTEIVRHRFVSVATGRGYRFIGHTAVRGNIADTREHRRMTTVPRGGQWAEVLTASEGTIRRRWARATDEQRETARRFVNALRTDGTVTVAGCVVALTIAPNERVTVLAGDDRLTGGSFTLESFSRRMALKS